ncbi:MAG: DUF2388 domain-containing protein [Pseudomonas sp.]
MALGNPRFTAQGGVFSKCLPNAKHFRSLVFASCLEVSSSANAETCQNSIACAFSGSPQDSTMAAGFVLAGTLVGPFFTSLESVSPDKPTGPSAAAREDAAAFIASDGELRGAFFESELSNYRNHASFRGLDESEIALLIVNASG